MIALLLPHNLANHVIMNTITLCAMMTNGACILDGLACTKV